MCDYPKCYSEHKPKAIKEHKCCECGGTIFKGEVYFKFQGIWDSPATFKTCADCQELREKMNSEVKDQYDKIPLGYMSEHIGEGDGLDELLQYMAIQEFRRGEIHLSWFDALERQYEIRFNQSLEKYYEPAF